MDKQPEINPGVFALADQLKALRIIKDALANQVKANNAELEETEQRLSDLMAEEQLQNFSRAGTTFYLSSRLYASPAAGRKSALFAALREQGHGALITQTVNANTLASFIKGLLEENGGQLPGWLEGNVNAFEKVSVGMKKS